jgi:hypothetical protein
MIVKRVKNGQLHPRFDAKAWLPFKMAQEL